ncbi:MAG: FAD-binding oxidoreductase [Chloroflexi bacterium]|nr:FAD-binding oxidoreductase [Chloroflexota bacterium]
MAIASHSHEAASEIAAIVGGQHVIEDQAAVQRFLKDNSWLSPILSQHMQDLKGDEGGLLPIDAVVSPANVDELRQVIAVCYDRDVPMTVRGKGTSNFGQSIPLEGGIILDLQRLNRILRVEGTSVTAEAGAIHGEVEKAAQAQGRELTLLTTTHATATVGGWVAGGHVGVGTTGYGSIWDGNVLDVKLLTAEAEPRLLDLNGEAMIPALHTYGTVGVLTEVTFPLVPARRWLEAVSVFDTFKAACEFTIAMSHEPPNNQRVVAAQEAPVPMSYTPLKHLFQPGQSCVLNVISETIHHHVEELTRHCGGTFNVWKTPDDQDKLPFNYLVYGHRMLWVKKLAPDAGFLHVYFSRDRILEQIEAIKAEFGEQAWIELKFMNSPYLSSLRGESGDTLLPAAVISLVPGSRENIDRAMRVCDSLGVTYLNPHTFVLEESGLFRDFNKIIEFKRQTDPKGLLNPGKIGRKFYKG